MKKVVAIIDFSTLTEKVIRHTIELAGKLNAEIILLYLTPPSSTLLIYDKMFKQDKETYLKKVKSEKIKLLRVAQQIKKAGRPVTCASVNGTHIKGTLQKLEELHPDYVIIGAKTRSWLDEKIIGSHWTELIASCKTPIIIIPDCSEQKIRHAPGGLTSIKIKHSR